MSIWYYQDANGIQHESYEAACHYYGVDTPAQCEAEARMWAEIEEEEELARRMTDAVIFDRDTSRFHLTMAERDARRAETLAGWDFDLDDECPF